MNCPQCGKPLPAAAGERARWRPFCSERCQLMDLGAWFAGQHAIPAEPEPDAPAEPPGGAEPRQ